MSKIRVYVGWEQRDALAYEVCVHSLKAHASIPVEVIALKEWELRRHGVYWRNYSVDRSGQMWDGRDGKPFSTNFSFTRFAVPILEGEDSGWVLFCDADMLWRADLAELIALLDDEKALMCVRHDHRPDEAVKMDGVIQTAYPRKNWSSLMVFKPWRNSGLTKYRLNNSAGSWLHGMLWLKDHEIGGLPEAWNWLEGFSSPDIQPKVVHYTRGTPDMPGYEGSAYADEWRAIAREIRQGAGSAHFFDSIYAQLPP